jgi:hypothetical protein
VRDEPPNIFAGEEERVSLSEFDVVLMRQDPPFDMGWHHRYPYVGPFTPRRWW